MKAILLALLLSGCCCLPDIPGVPGVSTMTLRAVDPSGKPVAGAVVTWEEKCMNNLSIVGPCHELGTTDVEGRLPFLKPKRFYALSVRKGNLVGSVQERQVDPSAELVIALQEIPDFSKIHPLRAQDPR